MGRLDDDVRLYEHPDGDPAKRVTLADVSTTTIGDKTLLDVSFGIGSSGWMLLNGILQSNMMIINELKKINVILDHIADLNLVDDDCVDTC